MAIGPFNCRTWITVSQSYTVKGMLRNMLNKFYDSLQRDISEMDLESLIDEVKNYLQQKRYVVVFDDVWNEHFWNQIESALLDNKNGSRIVITTRKMDVVMSCKISSFIEVHEMQRLTEKQSLALFNKKAFGFDFDGCCPKELIDVSVEIVKKCEGLTLAIVAIGGLLAKKKERSAFEWKKVSENLSLMLKSDSHLIGINKILGFSYNDLPYYLQSCLLYFGIYPEDCEIKSKRLIRQWIAEGFVKEESGQSLEEVAEGYLTELINRSLVQVISVSIFGRAKCCRVHDLIREMILEKFEDLSFCRHISEDGQSSLSGIIRRLSISTSSIDLATRIERSHVRSPHVFTYESLPEYFMRTLPTKYRLLLKVLDFEDYKLLYDVPENLGNLIHLRYLSFRYLVLRSLPESIGMLHNLETLDIGRCRMPLMGIRKLKKLRHLLTARISLSDYLNVIGGLTSLQTLRYVYLGHTTVELIRELGNLRQLKNLGLVGLRTEHGSALCYSLNQMQHLEKLFVASLIGTDLHLISSPPMLQNLTLCGKLEKLPKWIPEHQNIVKLTLYFSQLADDPIKSLKDMQKLLSLSILGAYEGETLHFEDGGFQKLKELSISELRNLNSLVIDKGALPSLEKLKLRHIRQLKKVPTDIQHLERLQVLGIYGMPTEFVQSIAPDGRKKRAFDSSNIFTNAVAVNSHLIL